MSAVPAARYLADFGADGDARGPHRNSASDPLRSGPTGTAKIEEAFARGAATGRAEAQAEFDAVLETRQNEFASRLAAERQDWATATGEELAKRLLAAISELEGRVAETTARILAPFVGEALRRQAVAELQTSLDALLAADSSISLSISGPADVLDELRAHLAGRVATTAYTPSENCDVRVVAGQTTLETCLKDWMVKLDEATR